MWKKISSLFLILMMTGFIVSAQTTKTKTPSEKPATVQTTPANSGTNYVDKNNDGVCDNRQNSQGTKVKGKNYVDKNNDGKCDRCNNSSKNCCQSRKHQGCGSGCGKGNQPNKSN